MLAVLGLCCCARALSGCSEWGLLFLVPRLLPAVASAFAKPGSRRIVALLRVESSPDQGDWPRPLHGQVDFFFPTAPAGSPLVYF